MSRKPVVNLWVMSGEARPVPPDWVYPPTEDKRSLTQRLCGDPLPGDRRRAVIADRDRCLDEAARIARDLSDHRRAIGQCRE